MTQACYRMHTGGLSGDVGGPDDASSAYAFWMRISRAPLAFRRSVASPVILPIRQTALAGTGSTPLLMGVGPKKMAIAFPGGQKPMSPTLTFAVAVSSSSDRTE